MKYALVEKHGDKLSVSKACELLEARRQGFYEWQRRRVSQRSQRDRALIPKIANIFYESNRIYGARKICALLKREDLVAGRKRVRQLMRREGMIPVTFRKRLNTTDSKHDMGVFPNLLQQDFKVALPNNAWVSDFTYISTDEGWLYLCSVIDLFSRRVVGWAVSACIDRLLAIRAFQNAVGNRRPERGFIFHTDRGSQCASSDFRSAVVAAGGVQSMSRSSCPHDNACAESFFKALKVECLDRSRFETRNAAEIAISTYLLFYNRTRVHQSLDYLAPAHFEGLFSA